MFRNLGIIDYLAWLRQLQLSVQSVGVGKIGSGSFSSVASSSDVKYVILHLPDLGVTINPSLVSVVRHIVEVGCFSDCVSYDNDLWSSTNLPRLQPSNSLIENSKEDICPSFRRKWTKFTLTLPLSFFPPKLRSS